MKRTLIAASAVLTLLAGTWFAGPYLFQGAPTASISTGAGGKPALALTVKRPGLFVDVWGAGATQALAGGKPAGMFAPWPKSDRLRVAAFFRRPVQFAVTAGDAPFDLRDLPRLVSSAAAPEPDLPDGWRQASHYVGQFTAELGDPVSVMVPGGMAGGADAADKVRKLYPVAEKLFGRPPVREKVAVVTGPEPARVARAVVELWVPAYAPDARWWEDGAVDFYTQKLLDQTKSWGTSDRSKWLRTHNQELGYVLALWLDASLRTDPIRTANIDTLLTQALSVRTEAQFIETVQAVGGIGLRFKLDRILERKDPLPVTVHS